MATWTALLADWTNKAVSVLRLNAYLGSGGNLDWLKLRAQRPIALTGGTLTIATGVITVAPVDGYGHYKVATQSAAAADDLDTISGGADGDVIMLEMATAGQVPTIKNASGNILLVADVTLASVATVIVLRRDGTNWKLLAPTGDLNGGNYQIWGYKGKQNVQTDSYTTVDGDNGKVIVMNKATGCTLTIHQAAPADFNCLVIQKGAGQVTIASGGTGAIRNRSSHTKIAGQYGMVSVYVESNAGTAPQIYLVGDTTS